MHQSPAERSWFALRVRSRHEKVIASALCDKGNEVFLPLYRCERRWSDRVKDPVGSLCHPAAAIRGG